MKRAFPALGLLFLTLDLACGGGGSSAEPPPPQPGFSLTASPTSITLPRSGNGSIALAVAGSHGFSGSVALSLVGQPAGIQASFAPSSTTTASTLQLGVGPATAAGTYTVTVKGASPGLPDATLPLTVQVTDPAPVSLLWAPSEDHYRTTWCAYQDGDGPWTVVEESGGGFPVTLRAGRGGLAWASTSSLGQSWGPRLRVVYGTAAELAAQAGAPGEGFTPVRGLLKNRPSTAQQVVSIGPASGSITSTSTATYWQVEGVRKTSGQDFLATVPLPVPMAVFRSGVVIPAWPQPLAPELDFASAESFELQPQRLSVAGDLPGDTQRGAACYLHTPGLEGGLAWTKGLSGSSVAFPAECFVIPAAKLPANGLQRLVVSAGSQGSESVQRTAERYFTTPSDLSLTLPAPIEAPVVDMASPGRPRYRTSFQAPYDQGFSSALYQEFNGAQRQYHLAITRSYLLGSALCQPEFPDLSGLPGWNPDWSPRASSPGYWTVVLSSRKSGQAPAAGDTAFTCTVRGRYLGQ